ncbi:MAG: arsenite methyltransferase [Propionibacteriaceae bacterium]|nr:arsenite methyltransferase [Propionibacteriaceae bacterium]
MNTVKNDEIRQAVRENYGQIAVSESSCCDSSSCCTPTAQQPQLLSLQLGYSQQDLIAVPEGANLGLGCGNPQAIADLQPGETVLDLGSGAGFDCFLAAAKVGPRGRVIGVDMTPQMITKARANAQRDGYDNVEFRLGEIEHLPVADASVDAVISNCVINLSPDKANVFAEAFRVLRPGGRLAISDVVAFAPIPDEVRDDLALLSNCVSGAEEAGVVERLLQDAGFEHVRVDAKEESKTFMAEWAPGTPITDYVVSATIEARKPVA